MNKELRGIDISHHNGIINWEKVDTDFAIIKCTQGTKFLDPKFQANKNGIQNAKILCGYYHFADAGDPLKEADWFLKNVSDIQEGELVVLDYETYALADPADWCLRWLTRVEKKLGFKPLLYTYHGLLKKYNWSKVSENGNALWAARYGLQEQKPNLQYQPATGSWKNYTIWQFCSKGKAKGITGNVDLNVVYLSLQDLKKFGKPKSLLIYKTPEVIPNVSPKPIAPTPTTPPATTSRTDFWKTLWNFLFTRK